MKEYHLHGTFITNVNVTECCEETKTVPYTSIHTNMTTQR